MQPSHPTISYYSSTYVRLLFDYLASKGLDAQCILGEAPPDASDRGLGRYSAARWCLLLEKVSVSLGEPQLGLNLGRTIRPAHLGVLGYVLMACRDAGAALLRWQQFETLISDLSHVSFRVEDTSVVLEWFSLHERQGSLSDETAVTALVEFARNIVARPFQLQEVRFTNPAPSDISPYLAYFGCPVQFDQPETLLRSDISILTIPLRQTDAALLELMKQQAETLLAALPPMDDLEQMIRSAIARLVREGEVSSERVAGELNMSTRTLHRRLAKLGCNFRDLREDTRRLLALDYLKDSRLSLGEVAWLLGYSELSAFSRAFKRWAGHSTSEWRDAQNNCGRPLQ